MKIDDTNITIIKHLKDGRKSFKLIADELSITENTVRGRVNKLIDEGVLDITGLVDPQSLPGHQMAIIGVKLNTMNLGLVAKKISKLRGVINVSVVTGRYDLFVQALLNADFGLIDFYTQEVTKIPEVVAVETYIAYQSFELRVPYIL
ncbi:MAG: Lrp/AsnC family transcriptional regulator [Spirochaetales bacterium]|jgi:Lrp/AsnC family transcriptional regulator for asnA, asnC and gidA|nr:Lrp/AsnC family transcriptional regulator [Spirochaetales bacterium]